MNMNIGEAYQRAVSPGLVDTAAMFCLESGGANTASVCRIARLMVPVN